jgi:2-C-methyl-D-erythritol 4-phosphate cytidylyltransferase
LARAASVVAILLAAGAGRRAGGAKQFRRAGGRTLLEWACEPFLSCREIGGVVVVAPAGELARARSAAQRALGNKLLAVVAGGRTRHLSSRAGLAAVPATARIVLIHDVARPFASAALLRRVLRAARRHGAAIPVLPVVDSILEADAQRVLRYLDRTPLRSVQTPQGFEHELLKRAFARAARRRSDFSDDAGVVLAAGAKVHCVEGEAGNRKITARGELRAALRELATRR